MPCKFCSSASHTLAKCNSPLVIDVVNTVTALINSSPFKLREQVDLLKNFTVVQLSVVCRNIYGLPCQGTKNESIGYIIDHFFGHLGLTSDAAIQTFDQATTDTIDQEYDNLIAWLAHEKDVELRSSLLADMEIYYSRRYGIRRYMYPIATFYEAVNYLQAQHEAQITAIAQLLAQRADRHADRHAAQKLAITVTVAPDLLVEDCCICLDEKQMSSFNCGHSCCGVCLTSMAKKRTKSFICCPLCRAEIQTLRVVNDDVLKQMNQDLISC